MIEKRLVQWYASDAGVDLDIAEREIILTYVLGVLSECMFRPMPTIDSDGCRPLVPGYADHSFQRHVDHFSELVGIGGRHRSDSVDGMFWNPGVRN